jgi:hypothetical protein
MSTNITFSVAQAFSPEVIARIASAVGLDKSRVEKTLSAGAPALLAVLSSFASKPGGATAINTAISRQEPGILSNLMSRITSGSSLFESGESVVKSLLGGQTMGTLISAVSRYTGVGESSTKSLMSLLAPVVLGTLGEQQQKTGISAADLLSSQASTIASSLPGELAASLERSGIVDDDASMERASTSSTERGSGRPNPTYQKPPPRAPQADWMGWFVPVVAAFALAGLGWYALSRNAEKTAPQTTASTPAPLPATTEPPRQTTAPEVPRQTTTAANPSQTTTATPSTPTTTAANPPPQDTVSTGGASDQHLLGQLDTLRGIKIGDVDVGAQIGDAVKGMQSTLVNIKDEASARAATEPLKQSAATFDGLVRRVSELPPDSKRTIASAIAAARPMLDQALEKALQVPGVSELVKPSIDNIRSGLDTLTTV